jgi:hypothetical protein
MHHFSGDVVTLVLELQYLRRKSGAQAVMPRLLWRERAQA